MQEVCGNSRLLMAILRFDGEPWGSIALLTSYLFAKHMRVVDKSTFADIFGEAAWSDTQ